MINHINAQTISLRLVIKSFLRYLDEFLDVLVTVALIIRKSSKA